MKHNNKKFIVYCHKNKVNGKRYIGITCQQLNQRFRNWKGYKSSPHFNHAIQKYGWGNSNMDIILRRVAKGIVVKIIPGMESIIQKKVRGK